MLKKINNTLVHHATTYKKALELIQQGSVLIYPTETFYALGCSFFSKDIPLIYTIKKRSPKKQLPIIVHSLEKLFGLLHSLEEVECALFSSFPNITLILPLPEATQTFGRKTIAVRLATTPFLKYITQEVPLIATSANISTYPSIADYNELDPQILQSAPIYLPEKEEDTPKGFSPSTIIQVIEDNLYIKRHGTISSEVLRNANFTVID